MKIARLFAFLTIFGLLFLSTAGTNGSSRERTCVILSRSLSLSLAVVNGKEDIVEADAQVDDEDEVASRAEETATPASDVLVSSDPDRRTPTSPCVPRREKKTTIQTAFHHRLTFAR